MVGCCTDRAGLGLVHFKHSRLTAAQVKGWVEADSSAAGAIVRVFWLGSTPGRASSLEDLVQQLLAAGPAPGGMRLRLQCWPRSLETWLGDQLPGSFNLQPVNPDWVLHIVRLPAEHVAAHFMGSTCSQTHARKQEVTAIALQQYQQNGQAHEQAQPQAPQQPQEQQEAVRHPAAAQHQQLQPQQQQQQQQQQNGEHTSPTGIQGDCYLYCLQPAHSSYFLAPLRGKRVPNQLSKAAGKLAEAVRAVGLDLTAGLAVDLGAAPGGWTRVLARCARRVIAVDPAALDERALVPGVVTHLACKAEAAVPHIVAAAGEAAGIDLLVCDINHHPAVLISIMQPLLPLVRPGGAVIMTLKFYGRSATRAEEWQAKLAQQLGPDFERVQCLWLLANTQHEQTCVAFKSAAPAIAAAAS